MCFRILMAILLTATCVFGQMLVGPSASALQLPFIVTSSDPQALAALAGLLWMVLPQLAPAQSLYYLYNGG